LKKGLPKRRRKEVKVSLKNLGRGGRDENQKGEVGRHTQDYSGICDYRDPILDVPSLDLKKDGNSGRVVGGKGKGNKKDKKK